MLRNFCFANSIPDVSALGFWAAGNSQWGALPTVSTKATEHIRELMDSSGRLENEAWKRKSEAAGSPAMVLSRQATGLRGRPP